MPCIHLAGTHKFIFVLGSCFWIFETQPLLLQVWGVCRIADCWTIHFAAFLSPSFFCSPRKTSFQAPAPSQNTIVTHQLCQKMLSTLAGLSFVVAIIQKAKELHRFHSSILSSFWTTLGGQSYNWSPWYRWNMSCCSAQRSKLCMCGCGRGRRVMRSAGCL